MNKIDKDDLLDIKLFNIIENETLKDKEKELLELADLNKNKWVLILMLFI